jgi:hypothetical protein
VTSLSDRVVRQSRVLMLIGLIALAGVLAGCPRETTIDLGSPERVADGVQLYRLADPNLLTPPGRVAIQILRLDPSRVTLRSALAHDRIMQPETVPELAARTQAIAAVNAGFFNVKNGEPAGLLKVAGELVSDTNLPRGAVGILRRPGKPATLLFDRVSAALTMRFKAGDEAFAEEIDGVDTTRVRGKLMLYTPRFGPDSDMADTGVEWQLDGSPLRVVERRPHSGRTPIPPTGVVLSFGGTVLSTALERLDVGQVVTFDTRMGTRLGSLPDQWAAADDAVGGAGLIVHRGQALTEWADEQLRAGFNTERHPRTMIGQSAGGAIWLVTIDGRNPALSLGMTFAELQNLARKLNLVDALNLDGGGSTTMVVRGKIVNHPSDAAGPRKVSDALIVTGK